MNEEFAARILAVDDEVVLSALVARWLGEGGYVVESAASAEEALAALADEEFHLLISDINMPGMSGVELLAVARERFPHLAVIMATGVDDRETAIRCLRLGAYGYVIKPFYEDELIINVVNALERRRLVLASRNYQRHLEEEVRKRTAAIRHREEEISLRLVAAGEYHDRETGRHVRRIGLFAELLAKELGWDDAAAEEMRLAAPMHDVGKIGIPDRILSKPGKLSADEFEIIKQHTRIGTEMLAGSSIPLLRLAQEIALTHQEKWDGSGYPRGLKGPEIPAAGRLVAIVDVYDALVHDRVYRAALPEEEALEIMRAGRGSHFDPQMFDAFVRVLPDLRRIRKKLDRQQQRTADRARPGEPADEASNALTRKP